MMILVCGLFCKNFGGFVKITMFLELSICVCVCFLRILYMLVVLQVFNLVFYILYLDIASYFYYN